MSAAPNNRARLTRYNVAAKVGSSSLSLVRVQEGDFRWLKRRRWLKSYCCCSRSTTDVGADGGSAAAGPSGRNRCGGSATRDEAVNNED